MEITFTLIMSVAGIVAAISLFIMIGREKNNSEKVLGTKFAIIRYGEPHAADARYEGYNYTWFYRIFGHTQCKPLTKKQITTRMCKNELTTRVEMHAIENRKPQKVGIVTIS